MGDRADGRPPRRRRRWLRWAAGAVAGVLAAATAASFGYNLATDGPAPRPAGLHLVSGGGFVTRYRTWGRAGSPVVLVPGAFETADTFAALSAVLGREHRVFALDLTGTGYSRPSPPFSAGHLAAQVLAFLAAERLAGPRTVLVGHSSGAAVAGLAAVRAGTRLGGVVFLDGDATPLSVPPLAGWLLINPFRTTILRLALNSSGLIRRIYRAQCGPVCAALSPAGVRAWREPLQQPGFSAAIGYTLRHGIPSLTSPQFAQLRAAPVAKRVIVGADDPQLSVPAAARTAGRIGAPAPVVVPGRHLTMISSPRAVAAAIEAVTRALPR